MTNCHQKKDSDSELNLNFEKVENGMPKGWYIHPQQPNYLVFLDSVNIKSEKYSIAIEFMGDSAGFQLLLLTPSNLYDGEKITLSGYIKTENVTDGYAGLCMLIDPQEVVDEMRQNGVTATTDWKKYEITLDMNPAQAQQITFGGLFVGKGKMWLDDIKVSIDGKDIEKIQPIKPEPFSEKAKNDREFDQGSNNLSPDHKTGQKEIWLDSREMWIYHRHRKEDTARSYRYTGKDIGYITLKTIKSDDVPVIKKRVYKYQRYYY